MDSSSANVVRVAAPSVARLLELLDSPRAERSDYERSAVMKFMEAFPVVERLPVVPRGMLCDRLVRQTFAPGDVLMRQSERCTDASGCYFVLDGSVAVFVQPNTKLGAVGLATEDNENEEEDGDTGAEEAGDLVARLGPGAMIGDLGIVGTSNRRPATVVASVSTEVASISRVDVHRVLRMTLALQRSATSSTAMTATRTAGAKLSPPGRSCPLLLVPPLLQGGFPWRGTLAARNVTIGMVLGFEDRAPPHGAVGMAQRAAPVSARHWSLISMQLRMFAHTCVLPILRKPPASRTDAEILFLATCLRRFPLLSQLPATSVRALCRYLGFRQFRAGARIRQQGRPLAPECLLLLSGRTTVQVQGARFPRTARTGTPTPPSTTRSSAGVPDTHHGGGGTTNNTSSGDKQGPPLLTLGPGDAIGEDALSVPRRSRKRFSPTNGADESQSSTSMARRDLDGGDSGRSDRRFRKRFSFSPTHAGTSQLPGREMASIHASTEVIAAAITRDDFDTLQKEGAFEGGWTPSDTQVWSSLLCPPSARDDQHVSVIEACLRDTPFTAALPRYIRLKLAGIGEFAQFGPGDVIHTWPPVASAARHRDTLSGPWAGHRSLFVILSGAVTTHRQPLATYQAKQAGRMKRVSHDVADATGTAPDAEGGPSPGEGPTVHSVSAARSLMSGVLSRLRGRKQEQQQEQHPEQDQEQKNEEQGHPHPLQRDVASGRIAVSPSMLLRVGHRLLAGFPSWASVKDDSPEESGVSQLQIRPTAEDFPGMDDRPTAADAATEKAEHTKLVQSWGEVLAWTYAGDTLGSADEPVRGSRMEASTSGGQSSHRAVHEPPSKKEGKEEESGGGGGGGGAMEQVPPRPLRRLSQPPELIVDHSNGNQSPAVPTPRHRSGSLTSRSRAKTPTSARNRRGRRSSRVGLSEELKVAALLTDMADRPSPVSGGSFRALTAAEQASEALPGDTEIRTTVARSHVQVLRIPYEEYEYFMVRTLISTSFPHNPVAAAVALRKHPSSRTPLEVKWLTEWLRLGCPFMRNLEIGLATRICEVIHYRPCAPGEVIIYQGDVADSFFLILNGDVHIHRKDPQTGLPTVGDQPANLRERVAKLGFQLGTLTGGDSLGHAMLAADDSAKRNASVVANDAPLPGIVTGDVSVELALVYKNDYRSVVLGGGKQDAGDAYTSDEESDSESDSDSAQEDSPSQQKVDRGLARREKHQQRKEQKRIQRGFAHIPAVNFTPSIAIRALQKRPDERSANDVSTIIALLSQLPFLQQLTQEGRDALCRRIEYRRVPSGTVLCQQGDIGTEFFVLLTGTAGVYVSREDKSAPPSTDTPTSTPIAESPEGEDGEGDDVPLPTLTGTSEPQKTVSAKSRWAKARSVVRVASALRRLHHTVRSRAQSLEESDGSAGAVAAEGHRRRRRYSASDIFEGRVGALVAQIQAGDSFGESALLERDQSRGRRNATVATTSNAELLVLRRDDFLFVMRTVDPGMRESSSSGKQQAEEPGVAPPQGNGGGAPTRQVEFRPGLMHRRLETLHSAAANVPVHTSSAGGGGGAVGSQSGNVPNAALVGRDAMRGARLKLLLQLVRGIPAFQAMDEEMRTKAVSASRYKTIPRGKLLFAAGEGAADVCVIISGRVGVFPSHQVLEVPSEASTARLGAAASSESVAMRPISTITSLSAGDTVGEAAVWEQCRERLVTAVASDETRVITIPFELFEECWPANLQSEHRDRWDLLRSLPGFGKSENVPAAAVAILHYLAERRVYSRHNTITEEGKPSENLCVVLHGDCDMIRRVLLHDSKKQAPSGDGPHHSEERQRNEKRASLPGEKQRPSSRHFPQSSATPQNPSPVRTRTLSPLLPGHARPRTVSSTAAKGGRRGNDDSEIAHLLRRRGRPRSALPASRQGGKKKNTKKSTMTAKDEQQEREEEEEEEEAQRARLFEALELGHLYRPRPRLRSSGVAHPAQSPLPVRRPPTVTPQPMMLSKTGQRLERSLGMSASGGGADGTSEPESPVAEPRGARERRRQRGERPPSAAPRPSTASHDRRKPDDERAVGVREKVDVVFVRVSRGACLGGGGGSLPLGDAAALSRARRRKRRFYRMLHDPTVPCHETSRAVSYEVVTVEWAKDRLARLSVPAIHRGLQVLLEASMPFHEERTDRVLGLVRELEAAHHTKPHAAVPVSVAHASPETEEDWELEHAAEDDTTATGDINHPTGGGGTIDAATGRPTSRGALSRPGTAFVSHGSFSPTRQRTARRSSIDDDPGTPLSPILQPPAPPRFRIPNWDQVGNASPSVSDRTPGSVTRRQSSRSGSARRFSLDQSSAGSETPVEKKPMQVQSSRRSIRAHPHALVRTRLMRSPGELFFSSSLHSNHADSARTSEGSPDVTDIPSGDREEEDGTGGSPPRNRNRGRRRLSLPTQMEWASARAAESVIKTARPDAAVAEDTRGPSPPPTEANRTGELAGWAASTIHTWSPRKDAEEGVGWTADERVGEETAAAPTLGAIVTAGTTGGSSASGIPSPPAPAATTIHKDTAHREEPQIHGDHRSSREWKLGPRTRLPPTPHHVPTPQLTLPRESDAAVHRSKDSWGERKHRKRRPRPQTATSQLQRRKPTCVRESTAAYLDPGIVLSESGTSLPSPGLRSRVPSRPRSAAAGRKAVERASARDAHGALQWSLGQGADEVDLARIVRDLGARHREHSGSRRENTARDVLRVPHETPIRVRTQRKKPGATVKVRPAGRRSAPRRPAGFAAVMSPLRRPGEAEAQGQEKRHTQLSSHARQAWSPPQTEFGSSMYDDVF